MAELSNWLVSGAAVVSMLITVSGVIYTYTESKTTSEMNQKLLEYRITEDKSRIDGQIMMNGDVSIRLARVEERLKYLEQGVAELKLAIISKKAASIPYSPYP